MGTGHVLLYIVVPNSKNPNIWDFAWEQMSRALRRANPKTRPHINEITASIQPKLAGRSG